MNCAFCQHNNPPGMKFCVECGKETIATQVHTDSKAASVDVNLSGLAGSHGERKTKKHRSAMLIIGLFVGVSIAVAVSVSLQEKNAQARGYKELQETLAKKDLADQTAKEAAELERSKRWRVRDETEAKANAAYHAKNWADCMYWYKKVIAEFSDFNLTTNAHRRIGEMFYYGNGVEPNGVEAVFHFKEATGSASFGDNESMELLGDIYRLGTKGIPKDRNEAIKWYRRIESKHRDSVRQRIAEFDAGKW